MKEPFVIVRLRRRSWLTPLGHIALWSMVASIATLILVIFVRCAE